MKRTQKAFELSGTTIGFKSEFLPCCDGDDEEEVDLVEREGTLSTYYSSISSNIRDFLMFY